MGAVIAPDPLAVTRMEVDALPDRVAVSQESLEDSSAAVVLAAASEVMPIA